MKIKYKIFLFVLFFVVLFFSTFSYQSYQNQQNMLMRGINERLYTAAIMARATLAEDYHDRIVDSGSVSKEEFDRIVDRYNKLCVDLGMEYLWSLMVIDGKIVFTSSTSPDKDVANQKHAKFFEIHSNPKLYYKAFSTMKPQYQINGDKWGRIKAVLVPFKDIQGRPYLFGASLKLSEVDQLLQQSFSEWMYLCLGFIFIGFLFSYALADLIGRPFQKLISEILKIIAGGLDRKIAEKGSYEEVILARNFNKMWQVAQENVSALKASKETLEVFKGVVESATDAIGMATPEGKHYYQNEAFVRMVGDFGQVSPATAFVDQSKWQEVFQTMLLGKRWVGEIQMYGLGHKILDVFLRAYAIKNSDGRIVTLVGVFTDITDRKKAAERLRDSENKFRTMFENMVEGVALHELIYDDSGRSIDYRILNVNPAYEKHTGLSVAQVVGKGSRDVYGTAESPYFEIFKKVALTMKSYIFETYFIPLKRHFMISVVSPCRGQFATIFQDITEVKEQEEALQKAVREKDTLLREIHHRVKNNVLFLEGLIELQQDSLNDSQDANEILETVKRRIRSVGLAHQLIYQAEDLSAVNFSIYIQNIVYEIERIYAIKERTVKLSFDLEEVELEIDRAVPCGLIVSELVVNAFKHAFSGREKGNIRILLRRGEGKMELFICDDGIGMEESSFLEGNTLGMKLVENLVKQINGTLKYTRKNGSEFMVRF